MRLKITLTPNREIVPYNHLPVLAGALHKWLGPNEYHGEISLYSFSWLQGGRPTRNGLRFPRGASWYISALDDDFLMRSIKGILKDGDVRWGMRVERAEVLPNPDFPDFGEVRFLVASPIFVKRKLENGDTKHYLYTDLESDELLTENLQLKLTQGGLSNENVSVRFDREYLKAKTQLVTYRGIDNRCSYCPVFVKGTKEQLGFAWTVGLGNSTGIGFGGLI